MVEYLQRVLGYALSGDTSERAIFLFHGDGRNGKTTIVEIIRMVLGDGLAGKAQIESFLRSSFTRSGGEASPDIAALHDKRFVWATEGSHRQHLDAGKLKEHSAEDTISARALHRKPFSFVPQYKLFLVTNEMPRLYDETGAAWDRVHSIPFNYRIPDDRLIKGFRQKVLMPELPGILRWCVQGSIARYRDGLRPPTKVLAAKETLRLDNDELFDEWFNERYTPGTRALADYLERIGFGLNRLAAGNKRVVSGIVRKSPNTKDF